MRVLIFLLLLVPVFLQGQDEGVEIPWLRIGNESYPPYSPEKPYTNWMTRYFKWGPFRVHAGASARFAFCDNIYYSQTDRVSDTLFRGEVLLRADLVRPQRHYLLIGTHYRRNQYMENSAASNNEFEFTLDSCVWFARNFDMGLEASFAQQVEPISILYADRYARGVLEALLFADWSTSGEKVKIRFELSGKNINFWGAPLSNLDHTEAYFNTLGQWQKWAKLALTARLGYGLFTYTESWLNDFSYITFYLGGRGEISPKTRFSAEIGLYMQSVDVVNSALDEEYKGPVWRATFEWQVTGKTLLYLQILRWVGYHAAANYQVFDSVVLKTRWVMTKRVYFEGTLRFETANPASQGGYLARFAWRGAANLGAYYRLKHFLYFGGGAEYVRRLSHVPLASYHTTTVYLHFTMAF